MASRKDAELKGDVATLSLWEATAAVPRGWPALSGAYKAQIVVVGAGYTGLSAAIHAAEAGFDVVVVDRHAPGWGASGQNGGQVIAGLKDDPATLERKLGGKLGAAVAAAAGAAPDLVFELIRRYGISCGAMRTGWLQLAVSPATLKTASALAQQWQRRGAPVELLNREQAASLSGSPLYLGGLLDRRGGTVHPLQFTRGLAEAATALGVRIFARTPVVRLSRAHYGWYVETAEGSISSRTVILATNAHTDGLWQGLQRSFVSLPSVQIASDPLPDDLRRAILPEGQAASDMRRVLRYFRLDGEGRLVIGTRALNGRLHSSNTVRHLRDAAREIFPQLPDIAFPYHWGGPVAITGDRLPHVHDLAPALLTGLGYNGRGIAMSVMIGRVLARWATGTAREDLGFPVTRLKAMEFPELATMAARASSRYDRLRDALNRR